MNDAPGIRTVAVAPTAKNIAEVTEAIYSQANFTSRVRTPRVGQVLLVENENGYTAAIKIKEVQVSEEGESGTVLSVNYKILENKSRNFADALDAKQLAALVAIDEALLEIELISLSGDQEQDQIVASLGHNGPPPEYALTVEELKDLASTLQSTRVNIFDLQKHRSEIENSIEKVSTKSDKIRNWVASRLTDIQSGAFQAAGAMLTTAAALKVAGMLDKVIAALGALF